MTGAAASPAQVKKEDIQLYCMLQLLHHPSEEGRQPSVLYVAGASSPTVKKEHTHLC